MPATALVEAGTGVVVTYLRQQSLGELKRSTKFKDSHPFGLEKLRLLRLSASDQQTKLPQILVIGGGTAQDIDATLLHPCDLAVRHLDDLARQIWVAWVGGIGRINAADADADTNSNSNSCRATDRRAEASIQAVCTTDVRSGARVDAIRAANICPRASVNAAATANRCSRSCIHASTTTDRCARSYAKTCSSRRQ